MLLLLTQWLALFSVTGLVWTKASTSEGFCMHIHFRKLFHVLDKASLGKSCREMLLKLQSANEDLVSQAQAAKEHIESNKALKKEVADLRFRLVMSGANAPPDARAEWEALKDDLVKQLQSAESQKQALQEQLLTASSEAAEKGALKGTSGKAELQRVQAELKAGQKQIEDLEKKNEELQAEVAQFQASADAGANPCSACICGACFHWAPSAQ
jgi:ribosomal protein L29